MISALPHEMWFVARTTVGRVSAHISPKKPPPNDFSDPIGNIFGGNR